MARPKPQACHRPAVLSSLSKYYGECKYCYSVGSRLKPNLELFGLFKHQVGPASRCNIVQHQLCVCGRFAGTDLNRSGVALEPDDLPHKLLVPYSHELVHGSPGHALGNDHCKKQP